jgi:antitoxin (DNA-binding transcriptional repressor) of toxin-antitoxin stability system
MMPRQRQHDVADCGPADSVRDSMRIVAVEYVVTQRGMPVAVIQPVAEGWEETEARRADAATRENADFWERMEALRAEIAAKWQSDKTAVELIDEQRR